MTDLDANLFQWMFQFAHRSFWFDDVIVFFAQYLPYILVVGFFFFVFRLRATRLRAFIFIEAMLAVILSRGIVTEVIRFFYHQLRPFAVFNVVPLIPESNYSFPSGHAAWFFALALVVWYHNRRLGLWYFVFALFNGAARVFSGVHWPLDIVGGIIVGVLSAFLVHKLLEPTARSLRAPVV